MVCGVFSIEVCGVYDVSTAWLLSGSTSQPPMTKDEAAVNVSSKGRGRKEEKEEDEEEDDDEESCKKFCIVGCICILFCGVVTCTCCVGCGCEDVIERTVGRGGRDSDTLLILHKSQG